MTERAFVIMQIGVKGSPERKRADEIFDFIVAPVIQIVGLEPYRADLDFTPGPITPKFLSELLKARLIIADLTGHNPNVFYELGIAHAFARPLISIADSSRSLPFDTKDERIIEIGEYSPSGLTYAQGEQAKVDLQESLKIVLADNYVPPSPLREVAASASIDQLAPENPVAAEIAQIKASLDEIRKTVSRPRVTFVPYVSGRTSAIRQWLTETGFPRWSQQELDALLLALPESTGDDADLVRLLSLMTLARAEKLATEESGADNKEEPSSTSETGSGEDTPA